ncbi:hypothetical protein PV328_011709 [Microctonus aethiopoides]|uniref:Cyclin-like domain-containing protein n=1 Tax=Microctonus aethiopoides TaxID=144406 RepID=A0AA39C3H3_9HYME|nr:hypothetical protein PV328_011709 [Microctonus aethiopoides]
MASFGRWCFSTAQIADSPSRKRGINEATETRYRQDAATCIQRFQRVGVPQKCINTAIVFMHRFYMWHSFVDFHRHGIAPTALFLAMKVHDEQMPLECRIREAFPDLLRDIEESSIKNSEIYRKLEYDLLANENIMLKTFGFELTVDQPDQCMIKYCEMLKVSSVTFRWAQVIATNSLHFTTLWLQYPPHIIGCFALYFIFKWSHLEIPLSTDGKPWYSYVDESITEEILKQMVTEFLEMYDRYKRSGLIRSLALNQLPKSLSETPDSGYKSESHQKKCDSEPALSPTKQKALSILYRPRKKRKLNVKD